MKFSAPRKSENMSIIDTAPQFNVRGFHMAPQVIASIVAAFTALVAVAVGPFLTIRASKTQMLGPMRQAWINSLRDTIAEFSSSIYEGLYQVSALLAQDDNIRHTAEATKHDRVQKTYQLKEKNMPPHQPQGGGTP